MKLIGLIIKVRQLKLISILKTVQIGNLNILICIVFYKSFFIEAKNPSASGITVYLLALGF